MTSVHHFEGVILKHLGSGRSDVRVLDVSRHLVHVFKVSA